MRALVTGGAGFIGSELTRQLVARGVRVLALDSLVNGRRENIADVLGPNCELIVADVRDTETVAPLMRGVDIIFHLACLGVRHSLHSPQENHEVNATATLQLLVLARKLDIGRFVYVSSSEVYGSALRVPLAEEDAKLPTTVYGTSKLAGEAYAQAFHTTYGYRTVVVRPFNTYGPRAHHEGDSGEVIPKFLLRTLAGRPLVIFGDGSQTRDFTHVTDTAAGILAAGMAESAIGRTFNLGSGCEVSIEHLAQRIANIVGQTTARVVYDAARPGDIGRLCADTRRAQHTLGFRARMSLDEGITSLKDWYLGLGESIEMLLEQEIERNWALTEISRSA